MQTVKLDERAKESRAIYIGRPIKVLSEHPAMEYHQKMAAYDGNPAMSADLKNII